MKIEEDLKSMMEYYGFKKSNKSKKYKNTKKL